MNEKFARASIGPSVFFSSISDPKFKHNRLSVNLIMPLEAATASANAVVPFILRKGYGECPDFSSLNARLSELYGAFLDAGVSKYGGYQIMNVSIKGLDDRFALEGEEITRQCAELLAGILLDPKFDDNGLFDHNDVNLEAQFIVDSIESEINEKRTYAVLQCLRTMCAGEAVAVRKFGELETAKKITPESATAAYKRIIENAMVEITFVGSGNPTAAKDIFEKAFAAVGRKANIFAQTQLRTTVQSLKEQTEKMELSQSKLVLGFRTGEISGVSDINALRVFAAVYGGTPFSKLFLNVREKLSLCYYCSSMFDVSTNIMLVDSGVEAENKQKALDEILQQLTSMQEGDFTDEDLLSAKMLMKNSITSVGDSLSSLEGFYISQILRGLSFSPQEDALNIDKVSREEVIAAAKKIALDTVYFLTGNQTEEGK